MNDELINYVRKHLTNTWKKPKPKLNSEPIELLERHLALPYRGLVIDSFCGTGESTKILSKEHPEFLVLGIDKSSYGLNKHKKSASKNYLLINEHCENIWEYLIKRGLKVDFHYIFYPNPWPKSKHLKPPLLSSAGEKFSSSFKLIYQISSPSFQYFFSLSSFSPFFP